MANYKAYLKDLEENADYWKKKYGTKTYSRLKKYTSAKDSYSSMENADITPSMRYIDDLTNNRDYWLKKYGTKTYESLFDYSLKSYGEEYDKARDVFANVSTGIKTDTLQKYGIGFQYSNDYEDQIRKIAGVAPVSFDMSPYTQGLSNLPESWTDEDADNVLGYWQQQQKEKEQAAQTIKMLQDNQLQQSFANADPFMSFISGSQAPSAQQSAPSREQQIRKNYAQRQGSEQNDQYMKLLAEPDFKQYADKGAAIENPSWAAGAGGGSLDIFGWQPFATEVPNKVKFYLDNSKAGGEEAYEYLTKDELDIYNYLLAKEGAEASDEYIGSMARTLSARKMDAMTAQAAEDAEKSPILASIGSVALAPAQGIGYLKAAGTALMGGEVDPNDPLFIPARSQQAIRGTVSKKIEGEDPTFLSQAGSFLYGTGMSIADFLTAAGVSGGAQGAALAIMGTGAATNTTLDAFDRGASQEDALALGLLAGAAEVIFEKFSLDHFLKAGVKGAALKNMLKQAGIEASEEAATEIANILSDALIMGDMSHYNIGVRQYMAQGLSEDEAQSKAAVDMVKQVGLSALAGAISGGVTGGVANIISNIKQTKTYGQLQGDINVATEASKEGEAQTLATPDIETTPDGQIAIPELPDVTTAPQERVSQQADVRTWDTATAPQDGAQAPAETTQRAKKAVVPDEMPSVEQDIVYDYTEKAAVAREDIAEYRSAVSGLQKTGLVHIKDMPLSETIRALESHAMEIDRRAGDLKNLKKPTITTKGLLPNEIQSIGVALADTRNAAANLRKAAQQIRARADAEIRTASSKLLDVLKRELKNEKKNAPEYQRLLIDLSNKIDTKAKSMTKETKQKLEGLVELYAGEDMPLALQKDVARLSKIKIADMSVEDIEALTDIIQAARKQELERRGESKMLRGQTIAATRETALKNMPKPKKQAIKHKLTYNTMSPQLFGEVLQQMGPDGIYTQVMKPVQEGIVEMARNSRYTNENITKPLEKEVKEYGADQSFSKSKYEKLTKVTDSSLKLTLTKAELLTLYANAMDIKGFEEIADNGFKGADFEGTLYTVDRQALRKFVDTFEGKYKDLYAIYEKMRDAIGYYAPKMNATYNHIHGYNFISERMMMENPNYFPLYKDGYRLDAPTKEHRMPNSLTPTSTKERTGGGVVKLYNPIWILNNYMQQANSYVSFAAQIYDANVIIESDEVKQQLKLQGRTPSGKSYVVYDYLRQWLSDTTTGFNLDDFESKLSKITGNFARANMTFNPAIAILQLTSYPAAMGYINPKYIANPANFAAEIKSRFNKEYMEYVLDVAPDMYDRFELGHSTWETVYATQRSKIFNGRMMREMDRIINLAMFDAAFRQTKAENKGLDKNSAEFKAKLADLFHSAIWNIQPMYHPAFRSPRQRTPMFNQLALFTSQTYQLNNQLRRGYYQIRNGHAGKGILSVLGVLAVLAAYGAGRYGLNKLRKKDASLEEQLAMSTLETAFPFGSKILQTFLTVDTSEEGFGVRLGGYDMTLPPLQALTDVAVGIAQLTSDKKTAFGKIVDLAKPAAQALGIPLRSIEEWTALAWEAIDPTVNYKYLKQPPTASQLFDDYLTGKTAKLPDLLPNDRSKVYDEFWGLMSDGKIDKEEKKTADRLLDIALGIKDTPYSDSVRSMTNSLENKAAKDLKEKNPGWGEERIEKEVESMGIRDWTIDFFGDPLKDVKDADFLFDLWKDTNESKYLLEDFTKPQKTDIIDVVLGITKKPSYKAQTEASQQKIVKDVIDDFYDLFYPPDPMKKYLSPQEEKADTKEYYAFSQPGWDKYSQNDKIVSRLISLEVYPKQVDSFNDKRLLSGSYTLTKTDKEMLARMTYAELLKYSSLTEDKAKKAIEDAYKAFKNEIVRRLN